MNEGGQCAEAADSLPVGTRECVHNGTHFCCCLFVLNLLEFFFAGGGFLVRYFAHSPPFPYFTVVAVAACALCACC